MVSICAAAALSVVTKLSDCRQAKSGSKHNVAAAAADCCGEALAGESSMQLVPQKPSQNEVDCTGGTDFCALLRRLHRPTVATVKRD